MSILVFRHSQREGLGLFEQPLIDRGVGYRIVELADASHWTLSAGEYAGVISLGGAMSAMDPLPGFDQELFILHDAAMRGRPVLGICLGAQLAARALGAAIGRSPVKEIGWKQVRLTASGSGDRLFRHMGSKQTVFQWHEDTFALPVGAERLAWSEACPNQGFRWGERVYGLQFHPEATPAAIEEWMREDEGCGEGREMTAPADPSFAIEARRALARHLMEEWLNLL